MIKTILKEGLVLSIFIFLLFTFSNSAEAAMQWSQVNENGFGLVPPNRSVSSMSLFNSYLYAAGDYGEIFRCSQSSNCDETSDWNQVGDFDDQSVCSMASFNNYLYAGTYDDGMIFRCGLSSGCNEYSDWEQVNSDGFGDANNIGIYSMISFNNYLYAGTYNSNGTEIYRCSQSSGCNENSDWESVNSNGFGDPVNRSIESMISFNNYLYVGIGSSGWDAKVYRCSLSSGCNENADWEPANGSGFANNNDVVSMVNYNNFLYIGTKGSDPHVAQVYRCSLSSSCDEFSDWSSIINNGFNDSDNHAIILSIFNNNLYAGTKNTNGGEVYYCSYSSGCDEASDWSQINSDGFGDSNNTYIDSMIVFDNQLYVSLQNAVDGVEIWSYADVTDPTISDQNPSSGATNVLRDTNIYFELGDEDLGVNSSTLDVTVEGANVIVDGTCQSGYVCTIESDGSGGYNVTINPEASFSYSQIVDISVNVADNDGDNSLSASWSFTTEVDTATPTITFQSPASGAQDVSLNSNIYFEADDSETGVNSSSIDVTIAGANAIIDGACQAGYTCDISSDSSLGYNVTINPNSDFSYSQEVSILASIADNRGNPTSSSWSFTTKAEPSNGDGDEGDEGDEGDTSPSGGVLDERKDKEGNPVLVDLNPKILTTSGPGEKTRLWAYDRKGNATNVKITKGLFPTSYLGGAGIIPLDQNNNSVLDQFVIFALNNGGPQARVLGLKSDGSLVLKGQMFLFDKKLRDGLSMTSGDFDDDGFQDDVAACLTGNRKPNVKVFKDATGMDHWQKIGDFIAPFGAVGCNLGTFQYDDKADEILVTPNYGKAEPYVYIYTVGGTLKKKFKAYNSPINQGLTASSVADRIYTTPNNGSSHVRVFDKNGNPKNFWWVYQKYVRGNFTIRAGDIDLDGKGELITSPIGANGPHVLAFEPTGKWRTFPNFFAFNNKKLRNGVGIAVIENWHGVN